MKSKIVMSGKLHLNHIERAIYVAEKDLFTFSHGVAAIFANMIAHLCCPNLHIFRLVQMTKRIFGMKIAGRLFDYLLCSSLSQTITDDSTWQWLNAFEEVRE
jgi:hypothetical protein